MSLRSWKTKTHLKCDEFEYNTSHFLTTDLANMGIDNVYYTSDAADRKKN